MAAFFIIKGDLLNIYVYSDESGVFDKVHNDIFVFGGLILLGNEQRDDCARKYSAVEKIMYETGRADKNEEMKASKITNESKNKLYRSLNSSFKFGVVIDQKKVLDQIFKSKKDKQRYLDYAYKTAIKSAFETMIQQGFINIDEVENIYFNVDEHSTATNGKYELCEDLKQELRFGTYNKEWNKYYEPVFKNVQSLDVKFCNSAVVTLVRAADIIANKIYYIARNGGNFEGEIKNRNMYIAFLP